jgi:hypothetical protein
MLMNAFIREAKYRIADVLFARELDETHNRAFKAGVAYAVHKISFDTDINVEKIKMTKVERKGYEKCQQVIKDSRVRIQHQTKADV